MLQLILLRFSHIEISLFTYVKWEKKRIMIDLLSITSNDDNYKSRSLFYFNNMNDNILIHYLFKFNINISK